MSNLISFPSTRFQQHSTPELRAARDQMLEVFAKLEEIRMAITSSASQGGNAPRIQLLDHKKFGLGAENGRGAGLISKRAGEG